MIYKRYFECSAASGKTLFNKGEGITELFHTLFDDSLKLDEFEKTYVGSVIADSQDDIDADSVGDVLDQAS
jgi:hypothetical protein